MAALAIPIEVQEQSLSQSTVILQVKFGLLGDSRKVSASQVEVDTDKQLLRVAKKILVSVEFEAIRQCPLRDRYAFPGSPADRGCGPQASRV